MMCYKDKWWCSFYKDCYNAKTCDRALTEEVIAAANAAHMDIQQVVDHPICHDPIPPPNATPDAL